MSNSCENELTNLRYAIQEFDGWLREAMRGQGYPGLEKVRDRLKEGLEEYGHQDVLEPMMR